MNPLNIIPPEILVLILKDREAFVKMRQTSKFYRDIRFPQMSETVMLPLREVTFEWPILKITWLLRDRLIDLGIAKFSPKLRTLGKGTTKIVITPGPSLAVQVNAGSFNLIYSLNTADLIREHEKIIINEKVWTHAKRLHKFVITNSSVSIS